MEFYQILSQILDYIIIKIVQYIFSDSSDFSQDAPHTICRAPDYDGLTPIYVSRYTLDIITCILINNIKNSTPLLFQVYTIEDMTIYLNIAVKERGIKLKRVSSSVLHIILGASLIIKDKKSLDIIKYLKEVGDSRGYEILSKNNLILKKFFDDLSKNVKKMLPRDYYPEIMQIQYLKRSLNKIKKDLIRKGVVKCDKDFLAIAYKDIEKLRRLEEHYNEGKEDLARRYNSKNFHVRVKK